MPRSLTTVGPPAAGGYFVIYMSKDTVATSQTDLEIYQWTVPSGMDITIVNVQAYCDVAGTAAATVDVEDDGTSVMTGNITLVADDVASGTLSTASGVDVAGGSLLTIDATTGATTGPSDVMVTILAYARSHPSSVVGATQLPG